jgi:hypothetical protein
MPRSPWNPIAEPYRAIWYWRQPGNGMGGWNSRTKFFATKAEAVAAISERFTGSVFRAVVHVVVNPETWMKNGRWQLVAERKRHQQIVCKQAA